MRVFISACGEGLGHTSRVLSLRDAFEKNGHEVFLAGYGASLALMEQSGAKVLKTLPEIRMTGNNGSFNFVSSIVNSYETPLDVVRAYLLEKHKMERVKADAVISDSRLSTVIAGAMAGLPTFYVTNQSVFKLPPLVGRIHRLKILQILSKARLPAEAIRRLIDVPLSAPYGLADAVLVPDFKPPDSLCLPLLSRDLDVRKKTYFTGPMSRLCFKQPRPARWPSGKIKVLVTFGGQAFRQGMQERIGKVAQELRGFDFLVAGMLVEKDMDLGNVRMRRFLPEIYPHAAAADFLVIPAGHSSIMEAILLGKPAIIIPDKGQPEQESNARRYEELGLGVALGTDRLGELGNALRELSAGGAKHRRKLAALAARAHGPENGALNTAKLISGFVERMKY